MSEGEGVKTKVCSKCKLEKPLDGFSKSKKERDRLCFYCKECNREYRKANSNRIREYLAGYYKANLDKIKERSRESRKANPEAHKEWRKANLDKENANKAKRKAKKLQATPPWLTKEHLSAIRDFYTKSKALEKTTGVKHHVDHIVPLQGNNVCGLHVPWNLQVLTATENCVKKNNYPNEWKDT